MLKLYLWIRNLLAGEEGQTLTEYALILVLIVIAALVVMGTMGGQINNIFQSISNELTIVP
ncbi:MAG: Flp family type IVb pilin [Anaerolineales bacterium]|nr:MAG: Flp family type IVb pilin [Anaerolineales bacterium]